MWSWLYLDRLLTGPRVRGWAPARPARARPGKQGPLRPHADVLPRLAAWVPHGSPAVLDSFQGPVLNLQLEWRDDLTCEL